MQLNGKLVVCPLWIIDSVKEHGLPISSLTDLNVLEEYLSSDDIISYHAVNKMFEQLKFAETIPEIQEPLETYVDLFEHIDLLSCANNNREQVGNASVILDDLYSNIQEETLVFLKESDGMKTFFNTMVSPSYRPSSVNPNIYVINLFHIVDQTFGLSIKLYDGITTDSELASLNDNMRLLRTHYKYEEVCQTQIFHRWCFKIKQNQQ